MGDKDKTEKLLEDYNDIFADIINVLLFGGKREVEEDELIPVTARSQYKADSGKLHEMERDVAKQWLKHHVQLVVYGLENQTAIEADIPFRIMGYDGQSYRSQLLGNNKSRVPVITLVLYFGEKRWDKPLSIKEILNIPDELEPYVNDYKINLFEIAYLSEDQVNMFQSDFRVVADFFVQQRKNEDYQPSTQVIKHVDAVLKLLSTFTGDDRFAQILDDGKEGVHTMCDVMEKAVNKGLEKGLEEGLERGLERGLEKGRAEERIATLVNVLRKGMPDDQVENYFQPTPEELAEARAQL